MLIKVALNGARPKSENKFIPQTLEEIKNEVTQLYGMGLKVFHIHCYDENGNESLHPKDVDNLVVAIKGIGGDIQVGISSGDWIEPDLQKRIAYIKQWSHAPDFISVNMIEDAALEVCEVLLAKGVLIEAGLNEKKAAEIFAESDLREGCCRVLIEPEEEELSAALKTVREIEDVLDSHNIGIKRLLHGFNSVAWNILREAEKRGYDRRIGMEDTIYLPDGKMVESNVEILQEAIKMIE